MADRPRAIELVQITKRFGTLAAADQISLTVAQGEFVALLGPSGCGKTTTLRLIAGLERPDHGSITIGQRVVADARVWVPPEQRSVGLVFQDGALFPHLTVQENIAFGLNTLNRAERAPRVLEMLELVGMHGLEARYPHQLSGGQQQRIALARALAPRPTVVLLDEPFSNLDAALRIELREEVAQILRNANTTAILVTHDQEEALSLADRVALMFHGRIVQHDTPQQMYIAPATRSVANFIGDANWLPAEAHGHTATCAIGTVPLVAPYHGAVDLLIRPEHLSLTADAHGVWRIDRVRYFGHDQLIRLVHSDHPALHARLSTQERLAVGMTVHVNITSAILAFAQAIA